MSDEFLRSHDAVQDFLRACAPGATIRFSRIHGESEKLRRYEITLDRVGRQPLHHTATYGLPVRAHDLREHVRRLLSEDNPWMR